MYESALDCHAVKNKAPSVQVEAGKGRREAVVEASACVCDNVKQSQVEVDFEKRRQALCPRF